MKPSRAMSNRVAAPIACYVGANGSGKTLAMVYDTLPSLMRGRPVLSTVPLYDLTSPLVEIRELVLGFDGEMIERVRLRHRDPHPAYVPLVSWRQLVAARHCDVLLDEVTSVASSRQHQALPAQLLNRLEQLRKVDVAVRWTSPNFARADLVLRELTQQVTVCNGYMARQVEGSHWPERSWFRWRSYDAADVDSFEAGEVDRIRPTAVQWVHRTDDFPAAWSYDTNASVTSLDHADMAGNCINCGGRRQVPKCSCPTPGEALVEALTAA